MDLRVDAFIPEKYIADGPGRIEAYKRIAAIQTAEDAAAALKAAERGWEEAVPENAAERAGALLFAAANAMRLAGVDAEEALTFASGRFRQELLQKTEDSDGQECPAAV